MYPSNVEVTRLDCIARGPICCCLCSKVHSGSIPAICFVFDAALKRAWRRCLQGTLVILAKKGPQIKSATWYMNIHIMTPTIVADLDMQSDTHALAQCVVTSHGVVTGRIGTYACGQAGGATHCKTPELLLLHNIKHHACTAIKIGTSTDNTVAWCTSPYTIICIVKRQTVGQLVRGQTTTGCGSACKRSLLTQALRQQLCSCAVAQTNSVKRLKVTVDELYVPDSWV